MVVLFEDASLHVLGVGEDGDVVDGECGVLDLGVVGVLELQLLYLVVLLLVVDGLHGVHVRVLHAEHEHVVGQLVDEVERVLAEVLKME